MEIRLRSFLLILLIATVAIVMAAIGLPRLGIDPLAFGRPATPIAQAAATQTLAGQRITFTDESAAWDWQPACQDALATWVQQSPNPIRTIRVTLTDEQNLGVATVGVGYPDITDRAATPALAPEHPGSREPERSPGSWDSAGASVAYAACNDAPDLVCQVAVKQGAAGADLDVAVTAAIPHAIRNAWLIHSASGAEQIAALRRNWSWEQFQPLLQKEGAQWRSTCINVSKP